MAEKIKNSKLIILKKTQQDSNITAPELIEQNILDFLNDIKF